MAFKFHGKTTSTYDAPSTDNAQYQVKGVAFTHMDGNTPALKAQSNGVLTARVRFILMNGKLGPTMSLPLSRVNTVVAAFDAECELLYPPKEDDPQQVGSFLAYAANKINAANKEVTVTLRNGFVRFITGEGIRLPEKTTLWVKPLGIWSKYQNDTGVLGWRYNEHIKTKEITIGLEVVAGNNGDPTVWEGATVVVNLPYGFSEDGTNWDVTESGVPSWKARSMESFLKTLTPDFMERLEQGMIEPANVQNMCPEISTYLSKTDVISLPIETGVSAKGNLYFKQDWQSIALINPKTLDLIGTLKEDLSPIPMVQYNKPEIVEEVTEEVVETPKPEQPSKPEVDLEDYNLKRMAQDHLELVMKSLGDGSEVMVDGILTPNGIEVAKKHLTPLKQSGEIEDGNLTDVTYSYGSKVLRALADADTLSDEQRVFVAKSSQEVDEALVFGDNPSW